MGLKRLLRMERRADVGDAVLQAFQDSLLGGPAGHVDPTATASVETSIRALSSPYGLATVTGPAMITPAFLADLARRLFTSGNAVYRIHVDDVGIYLVPASGFDVSGSSGLWVYELETPIPGQSRVARRRVAEDGVVHVRINRQCIRTLERSCTLATRQSLGLNAELTSSEALNPTLCQDRQSYCPSLTAQHPTP